MSSLSIFFRRTLPIVFCLYILLVGILSYMQWGEHYNHNIVQIAVRILGELLNPYYIITALISAALLHPLLTKIERTHSFPWLRCIVFNAVVLLILGTNLIYLYRLPSMSGDSGVSVAVGIAGTLIAISIFTVLIWLVAGIGYVLVGRR